VLNVKLNLAFIFFLSVLYKRRADVLDGFMFVSAIEEELKNKKIAKSDFYKATGISSATFSQWRNRIYSPSSAAIKKVEDYLGIVLTIEQKEKPLTSNGEELNYSDMQLLDAIHRADPTALKAIRVLLGIE
jgi:transcriptional regulator with XRE-family HTH domain